MNHSRQAQRIGIRAMILVGIIVLTACSTPATPPEPARPSASIALIPAPLSLRVGTGVFVLDAGTLIYADDDLARQAATHFIDYLADHNGLRPALAAVGTPAHGGIVFATAAGSSDSTEAYRLRVEADQVRIDAANDAGLFYGAMSLWQLLTDSGDGRYLVAAVDIEDAPRFSWRGLMLDSARHARTIDEIKRLLDVMAQHKLNRFHWHLTDDQGWRIEIRGYPRLTEVGGCRVPLGRAGRDPDSGHPQPYCAWYSQEQIREIVEYAASRYITVVPEIDIPGHAQAAVAAYPEFGVLDQPLPVSSEWGIHTVLFNIEEPTFDFLHAVFEQVMELFPGPFIHVGGDEAVKDQWRASAHVQQRMRELGLDDEDQLQSWFLRRIGRQIEAAGRRVVGWDEILEGGLPGDATVMSWRGYDGGIEAARLGHDVVMSPYSDLYFDYLQSTSANETPGRPSPLITLRKVYDYEPVPPELDADQARHILGAQANVWTEHLRTRRWVEQALFPRAAALAESTWSAPERRDWNSFLERLPEQLARYRRLGVDYATTAFEVGIFPQADAANGNHEFVLASQTGLGEIRYSLDGSEPDARSPRYEEPLSLTLPVDIRASAFVDDRALAPTTRLHLNQDTRHRRGNDELPPCAPGLPLRLEGDGPPGAERAAYTVDIFNPCWLYRQAPLTEAMQLRVRANRMPYNFQLWKDEAHRRSRPVTHSHGEFEIRAGCDGDLLAQVPLPAQAGDDGYIELQAPLPARSDPVDLCLYFTGDTRPDYWLLVEADLRP